MSKKSSGGFRKKDYEGLERMFTGDNKWKYDGKLFLSLRAVDAYHRMKKETPTEKPVGKSENDDEIDGSQLPPITAKVNVDLESISLD